MPKPGDEFSLFAYPLADGKPPVAKTAPEGQSIGNPRAKSPLSFWDWVYVDTVLAVGLMSWAFVVWMGLS